MSVEKMSSDEVPKKFVEWLLYMGYLQEKIPSAEKVAQKCRGQYYMVWRSLIEHVQPKDEVREKRLKVFCDDIRLCQKKNVFNEREPNIVVPEQLQLWRQQQELQMKVAAAEAQVVQARQDLHLIMDKVSARVCQHDISRRKLEGKQRRLYLLRSAAAELAARQTSLQETRDIAADLCASNDDDLRNKVDKCLALLRGQGQPLVSLLSNPAASSSVVSSQGDDIEEHLSSLSRARGAALWTQLCERRAALHTALAHANTVNAAPQTRKDGTTTRMVLSHTRDLYITLTLEAMKYRLHIKQTRAKFAAHLEHLNDYITGESCELLVLRCERANADARVRSLRTLLDELAANSGVFAAVREHCDRVDGKRIGAVDKVIKASRDELKRLKVSLSGMEMKINSTKEMLVALFNAFHTDSPIDRYKGIQINFPQKSLASICQLYEKEKENRKNKADLSLDFDSLDGSLDNTIDMSNPRFIDELRMYLKKFELEKNRKLIMDSGEKTWIFETLQSSLERMNAMWLDNDVPQLLCPSSNLSRSIQRIITEKLESNIKEMGCEKRLTFNIDITDKKEQEEAAIDVMKKKISENLQSLQKSAKLLQIGQRNLQLWQDNEIKNSISSNRTVDGKSYKEYEALYIETLSMSA